MYIKYENVVKGYGSLVEEFGSEILIFFGEDAPETLKDYCYLINTKSLDKEITEGDYLEINGIKTKIIAVGDQANRNLDLLGHLTIHLSGRVDDILPGAIVCQEVDFDKIKIGSKLKIWEE
ncbi:MAG: PTS glucitol/sorbitol transporter subunit IIA [Tissierellia bacterium]|nr:PTS glucitol/sorbitol transporter subunit IIA [Tissierellia bacterium]